MHKPVLDLKAPWEYYYVADYGRSWTKYNDAAEAYNKTASLKDHVRNSVDSLAKFLLRDFLEKINGKVGSKRVRIENGVGYWHITRSFMAKELTKRFSKVRNTYNLLPKVINFGLISGHSRSLSDFGKGLINCLELGISLRFVEYREERRAIMVRPPEPAPPTVLSAEAERAESTNYISKITQTQNDKTRCKTPTSIGNLLGAMFKKE
jgi:hypothetical protein